MRPMHLLRHLTGSCPAAPSMHVDHSTHGDHSTLRSAMWPLRPPSLQGVALGLFATSILCEGHKRRSMPVVPEPVQRRIMIGCLSWQARRCCPRRQGGKRSETGEQWWQYLDVTKSQVAVDSGSR